MEKAGVIVRDALAELMSSQPEQSLKPVDFNTGVRYLNRMLDAWKAIGIDLGTSRVQFPDDYLDIPSSAMSGVIFNLAIELANRFGYPVSSSLATVAAKHYQTVVRLFSLKPSSYSGNLPRGSGNALASESYAAFYPEDGAPIPDTSGECCADEIIQSETAPQNPTPGTLWLDLSTPFDSPDIEMRVAALESLQVPYLKLLPAADAQTNVIYNVISFYDGWAALALLPESAGPFVWVPTASKTLHNGVTSFAPEALSVWNGTRANLSALLNWTGTGNGLYMRLRTSRITPDMAGAFGDEADDTLPITKAISVTSLISATLYGTDKKYGVSGNITLPSWCSLDGLKLKQLTPNSISRRTLYQANGTYLKLRNIVVDRNGDGSGGSLSDAAGVWINDCQKLDIDGVEVFGNDFGSGIAVIRCNYASVKNVDVHDIIGGTDTSAAVTDDTIHGLWIQGGVGVSVVNPRIRNLLNRWSGQAPFSRFSRGIAVGGAKLFSISAPMVDNVDQGLDITGDQNAEFFEVNGGVFSNCYTWGTKCANSVQNGVFTGVVSYRCGQAGHVASAPSPVMPDVTQNITYVGCKSIQTGHNNAWNALANVAGFRVANTTQYPDYPRSIKYVGCSADGNGGNMEYGFFSDSTLGTINGETWIEAVHCDVQGATVKNYHGLQTGYARKRRSGTPQSIPNDVWTDLEYTETTDYMLSATGVSAAVLSATRSGIYMVTVGVTFVGNINGTRAVRVLLDGSPVPGSTLRIAVGDANERNISTSVIIPVATAGAQIKIQVHQSSGGALDVTGPTAFNLALISAGYGG